jgi:peptide-methionine (R)-S-oxide reductase
MTKPMDRRHFIYALGGLAVGPWAATRMLARAQGTPMRPDKIERSEAEWRKLLTDEQYDVLRDEGTERAWTSPLNDEKRKGTFVCAACALPLFSSDTKYDSGTGWPSFYDVLPDAVGTKRDFKLILPRTEYHCDRCGGHQGHVFNDGPQPTGLRYCNNGVAIKFVPAET